MLMTKESIFAHLDSTEEFPISLSDVWEWLGYSKKANAKAAFLGLGLEEGVEFLTGTEDEAIAGQDSRIMLEDQHNSKRGAKSLDLTMTIDTFKGWAMAAQTERGKEVRKYYLQVEKEWKALKLKTVAPPVSPAQVEAFIFDRDVFSPWALDKPDASIVLLGWKSPEVLHAEKVAQLNKAFDSTPTDRENALLGIIDNLSLAANRAGLAGNKSIKEAEFLAKQLDRVRELFDEQAADIERLTKNWKLEKAKLEHVQAGLEASQLMRKQDANMIKVLNSRIADLEIQLAAKQSASASSVLAVMPARSDSDSSLPALPPG